MNNGDWQPWELDCFVLQLVLVKRANGQTLERTTANTIRVDNLDQLRDYVDTFDQELAAANERARQEHTAAIGHTKIEKAKEAREAAQVVRRGKSPTFPTPAPNDTSRRGRGKHASR